jgi:lipopolysaccharide transport system permease protein
MAARTDNASSSRGHLITIVASRRRTDSGLLEAWASREVLLFLAWKETKIKYKQTYLGVGWAILQPTLSTIVFTLLFGKLGKISSAGVPYPVFVYVGLLPWTYFANVVPAASNSLVANISLLTKIYVPRMLIPASSAMAGMVDLMIATALAVPLLIAFHVGVGVRLLLLPLPLVSLVIYASGLGLALSALNVKYRDIRYVLPFFLQLLLFLSPVIYPPSIVPVAWRWVLGFNPMTGIIEGFRTALIPAVAPDWPAIATSTAISVVVLWLAMIAFRRAEPGLADVV